ncbi:MULTISPECIES: hypothetical protein [Moorena]|uniref:Uncharacterized protein n=1 Tax=Moorena producens 3L TaxID=489825 RepID=F4XKQ6_9CYAN|nr:MULTISPECIES: hypothetical protein [Moorena]EGJ34911.1 hypothetical protein LYNGBM3L_10540 [Moorena producens 3L]NEP32019.1 hypothetical protein [Moorena sp. SIO3B2]NEP68489.1 hypothetical protein [Moorena sp. SIO3A5]NEQ09243.1 hypothetical protein [Moorena sp. SIO4E2]NER90502.1 hypothetical protein [Moorena sp. SIO3A2]
MNLEIFVLMVRILYFRCICPGFKDITIPKQEGEEGAMYELTWYDGTSPQFHLRNLPHLRYPRDIPPRPLVKICIIGMLPIR